MMRLPRYAASALALSFAATGLVACGDPGAVETDTGPSCGTAAPRAAVFSSLAFTRVDEKGLAPGFDLDGRVSDGTDSLSCGKKDFVDPAGRVGIDNQLAYLVPDIENIVGDAVDGLIAGAINDGILMIPVELEHADDLTNDACTSLTVTFGEGKPTLGTDGVIEAYQTFDLEPGAPVSRIEGGRIEDGSFVGGPFELTVPIAIFDVSFVLHVHDAHFRFAIDEEGRLKGYFGGGIEIEEVLDGISEGAGIDKILPAVRVVLESAADLGQDEDGKCHQLSSALAFEAVPAFIRR